MAYLVQRHFKSAFKDFRMQDVEFYEDLKDVKPGDVFHKDYLALVIKETYKSNPSFVKALEAADFVVEEGYGEYLVCPACAKVWNLVNGNGLGKATKLYYVRGEWVDKKTAKQCVSEIFKEYGL